MTARQLVLWDIDGTLVLSGGVGRDIFADAFLAVFGRPVDPDGTTVAMNGRTDPEIAREVLARHAINEPEVHLPAFTQALGVALRERAPEIRARGHALPGALEALRALHGHRSAVQSVLTGNIQPNAIVKLAAFGLERYVDFDVGGFGSDSPERPRLVDIARRRAATKYATSFDGRRTVLVGDTPLDVAAAIVSGARVVAVATGGHDVDELRRAGASVVVDDLTDTGAVVDAVLDGT